MNRTVLKSLSLGTLLAATATVAACAPDLDHELSARGGTEGGTGDVDEREGPSDLSADGPKEQNLNESCDGTVCCPEGQTVRPGTSGADRELTKDPDICFVMLEGDDEVINNSKGAGSALGGDGDDYLRGPKGPGLLAGGNGDDRIVGNGDADEIYGGDGNDHIVAGKGDDLVVGGIGDDVINANNGADRIVPGVGRDEVDAGGGDDTVVIYDVCELQPGEILDGGAAGYDTLVTPVDVTELESLGVTVLGFENVVLDDSQRCEAECTPDFGETCPAGSNEITGTPGDDVLVGTPEVDCIIGLDGNDVLRGLDGDDVLWGGCGDDHLSGGAGDDSLYGAPGADELLDGPGTDTTRGEDGDDTAIIFHVCELEPGEVLDGGFEGNDTLVTPIPVDQLQSQYGVTASSFENVQIAHGADQSECVPDQPPANEPPTETGICHVYSRTAAVAEGEVSSVEYTYDDLLGPREVVTLSGVTTHFGDDLGDTVVLRTARGVIPHLSEPGGDALMAVSNTPPPYILGRRYIIFLHNTVWHHSPARLGLVWRVENAFGKELIVNSAGLAFDDEFGFVRDDNGGLMRVFPPNYEYPNWNDPLPINPDVTASMVAGAMDVSTFVALVGDQASRCVSPFTGEFFEFPHGTHPWNVPILGVDPPPPPEPCGPGVLDPDTGLEVGCE